MLRSISLPFQVLLDYNDLLKLPFYDIMDKKLNKDSVKLRYGAHILEILVQKLSAILCFAQKNSQLLIYLVILKG